MLQVRGLSKSFFGVPVLDGVDLDVQPGEVHGLVGENGAGKSTLMKILAGVHRPDGGEMRVDGELVHFTRPSQAHAAGISTVFQEFSLIPHRTVAENMFLGREPRRHGLVSARAMNTATAEMLASIGISSISPRRRVRDLSVAEQQIVEIAKALSYGARIISMDEPTAALADHEVALLYAIIGALTGRGVSVIYVSHRLKEVLDLCDRVTVLKDGHVVVSRPAADMSEADLVRAMVGREISNFFPSPVEGTTVGDRALDLTGTGNNDVDDVSLVVHRGEIVALAGLQGSGRSEVLQGIAGSRPFTRGEMRIGGDLVRIGSPRQAIRRGVAFLTEDRKANGLLLNQSVLDNVLAVKRATAPASARHARSEAIRMLGDLELKYRDVDQEIRFLSGGNQQKVLIAKWLLIRPGVLLLDEPTRGIDVGAKRAVYSLMRDLARQGMALLMVSSELPEVIGMADRVVVMHEGRVSGVLPAGASEEQIMRQATQADQVDIAS